MCVYSMIADHYRDKWPMPQPYPVWPMPVAPLPQGPTITWSEWTEYQELKRKAKEYDEKTGQPDCEKPEFEEWEKRLEDFLKKKGIIREDGRV